MPRAKTGELYISFEESKRTAIETFSFRAKGWEVVWAHLHPDHVHLWHNVGPPMVHEKVSYDTYEYLLATNQLRDMERP